MIESLTVLPTLDDIVCVIAIGVGVFGFVSVGLHALRENWGRWS